MTAKTNEAGVNFAEPSLDVKDFGQMVFEIIAAQMKLTEPVDTPDLDPDTRELHRNALAMTLAKETGFPFDPKSREDPAAFIDTTTLRILMT